MEKRLNFEFFSKIYLLELAHWGLHKKSFSIEKSHTREEGRANFRISFWHLLMTHEKQLLIFKKNVESGQ